MSEYNQGFAYEEQVGPSAVGRSVLEYLAGRYRHSSAAEWAERVRGGQVRLDGVTAAPSDRLRAGQHLVWRRPPWREPRVPLDFAILHADADVLAVAKPRGLPTMPAGGFLTHTLLGIVQRCHPEAVPVHRLGRGTSGVVLFARSSAARRRLPGAWQAHAVRRVYRALATGRPKDDELVIDVPIGRVPHPLLGSVHGVAADGRSARSTVRVVARGTAASLVTVEIATGRPDQIRIHLAAAGHPLVGDRLYAAGGRPFAGTTVLPGAGGYHLHAERVEFPHPRTGELVVVTCLPPPALRS